MTKKELELYQGMSEQFPSMACAIRREAARFESLHQTLDNLYNLLQEIDNIPVKIRMRELVNNIEDCFQHSPEFNAIKPTSDFELKLGVVGSITSGKSALIHRYLTGECPNEERLNGCHKKEVLVDGQSYLLLVRNETGSPDIQFVHWLDGLMLVFNVDDELSSSVLPSYYARISHYRDFSDIPVFLVGIKEHGTNCLTPPNHCSQIKRRLNDVNNCTYIEVCLETGETVNQMFQLASEKMANRESAVLTSFDTLLSPPTASEGRPTSVSSTVSSSSLRTNGTVSPSLTPSAKPRATRRRTIIFGTKTDKIKDEVDGDQEIGFGRFIPVKQGNLLKRTTNSLNKEWKKKFVVLNEGGVLTYYPSLQAYIENVHGKHIFLKQSTVKIPGKTPPIATLQGKNATSKLASMQGMNRTNSFEDEILRKSEVQENGSLVISNDFLTNDNEPEIKTALSSTANHIMAAATPTVLKSKAESINRSESIPRKRGRNRRNNKHTKSCELDFNNLPEELQKSLMNAANGTGSGNTQSPRTTPATTPASTPSDGKEKKWPTVNSDGRFETNTLPVGGSVKKKGHRRSKSHGTTKTMITTDTKTDTRNGQTDEYEFRLVSLDGKSWNFAAPSLEEREKWVLEIEQQILACLQSNCSGRDKMNSNSSSESDLQPIRNVLGNNVCADCGEPNPDWATLNLGALICIGCCGLHRNLGTHLSRVRSLDLDDWPSELRSVMLSIGNALANSIWEARARQESKPKPSAPREDKERWIRAKYQNKEFLKPLPTSKYSLGQRLIEAVRNEDLGEVILLLAHSGRKDVNEREDDDLIRTPLHISSSKGNVVLTLLLIWYFADVTLLDSQGRTALWYARESGSKECKEVLRNNGCQNTGRSLSCSGSSNSSELTS